MLIGDAQCSCGRLTVIHGLAAAIDFLAEAFTPELLEPESKFPKSLRVGKKNEDFLSAFAFQNELYESGDERRILLEWFSRLDGRSTRAFHDRVEIEAQ